VYLLTAEPLTQHANGPDIHGMKGTDRSNGVALNAPIPSVCKQKNVSRRST
jgi:hypothetical protein